MGVLSGAQEKEDAANRSNTAVAGATDNVAGKLLTENEIIGGESGAVFLNCTSRNFYYI
jgi:hypothetical protein